MKTKTKSSGGAPLTPLVDLSRTEPPSRACGAPDVVVVFELDHQQYGSARAHFDHLIDNHNISAHVHLED